MSSWFGKKKAAPQPTAEQVTEELSAKMDQLKKRAEHLESQAATQRANAFKFGKAKNKKKAMECMKRMKFYENQATSINGMAENLERQIFQMQQAALNASVFTEFQKANTVIKTVLGDLDQDKIADMKDEMEDQQQTLNELTDILSSPMGQAQDEDELADELAALMEEGDVEDEELVPTPTRNKPSKQKEDEELGDLMASFA